MLRKTIVIIPIILLALSGCSSKSNDASVIGAQGPTMGAPAASATPAAPPTPGACPTTATRKFAKTRFVTNAGLAAGASKRYIYTPYKEGRFKAGAPGHKRATVKAAAAGLFALDQFRRAKANAQANPTLCRVLLAPLDKLTSVMSGLTGKLKRGEMDPADIATASSGLEGLRRTAGNADAGFKDKDVPADMIGG
jgi:hypothetical protein